MCGLDPIIFMRNRLEQLPTSNIRVPEFFATLLPGYKIRPTDDRTQGSIGTSLQMGYKYF
jgi:hypothetical protein